MSIVYHLQCDGYDMYNVGLPTTCSISICGRCNNAIRRPTSIFHINLISSEFHSTLMFYQNPDTHTKLKDGLTLYSLLRSRCLCLNHFYISEILKALKSFMLWVQFRWKMMMMVMLTCAQLNQVNLLVFSLLSTFVP